MAATVDIVVCTGTDASTESGAQTGIDFCSIDTAANNQSNRQTNAINVGENSYEKWVVGKLSVAPDNEVKNFKVWTADTPDANTTVYVGFTGTGVTPTASSSSVATTDLTTYTSGTPGTWDNTSSLVSISDKSRYMVLQLQSTGSASQGDWTQFQIDYSYEET